MWAIIDSRAPQEAINNLKIHFDVFEFKSKNITYDEVSGHPDIFIFQEDNKLIIAPNSPKELIHFLKVENIDFTFGKKEVGKNLNDTTQYNCISNSEYIFHKKGYTDKVVLELSDSKNLIELPQAYTRCSLSKINDNTFITSDGGIKKALDKHNFQCLLVSPKPIKLPGYPYGFFGGTNGIFNNKMYLIGSLNYHPEGELIKEFIYRKNIEIIELYDGPLYDGGGIFFVDNQH